MTMPLDAASSPAVRRVPLPEDVGEAACCAFSADGQLLLLGGLDGIVQAVSLHEESPTLLDFRPPPKEGRSPTRPAILQIAISGDGQWIATADTTRRVHAHSVDGLCYVSSVPPLASPPTALAFVPLSAVVAIATANKQLTLYDVDRATLTAWSVANPRPVRAIADSSEVAHSIAFRPDAPRAAVLCAQSWLCSVPFTEAAEALASAANGDAKGDAKGGDVTVDSTGSKGKKSKKRKAGATSEAVASAPADPTHTVRSYGGMLLFDYLTASSAVVVEQPWLRVMELFPPALYKHRFGT